MKPKKIAVYNHKKIEKRWQSAWEKTGIYKTKDASDKPAHYVLDMFPYPSGTGLHVGHPKGFIATDIYARAKTMQGFNVLHPMGFDAFGLPAEQFAIKNKVHPSIAVKKNIAYYKKQLEHIGMNYDWSRMVDTTDPAYYRWTQWIFLQIYKHGLAYESYEPINWCPSCQTGLANEDLEDGKCERCGSVVEKKPMRQWVLKITDYADRLLKDLDGLNWPESVKESQRNWIGRSEGAEIGFKILDSQSGKNITETKVFTTRPDTLFGVTYIVLAPEATVTKELLSHSSNRSEIEKYIATTKGKTEIERTAEGKEKTGIEIKGVVAINPANNEEVPVWVADYVLADYGTGAVMAVPAHDDRDFAFAKKYNLEIRQVVAEIKKDYTALCTIRSDKKTIKRSSVVCIIKHWSEDKYLCLNWKKVNWHTPLTGGMEEGETAEETGAREIIEESGFKRFKLVGRGFDIIGHYYNPIKDVNRFEKQTPLFFELTDGENNEISTEEKDKHEMVWISKAKVEEYLNHDEKNFDARVALFAWSQYLKPRAITGSGTLINSDTFDGLDSEESKKKITEAVGGKWVVKYKLRDWTFSRQRYWGEPIPLVHCPKCGVVPVPEKDLPVTLPKVRFYEPTGTGESPLAGIDKWVNTKCPSCGGKAKRETNTMPQWAGSSWYYLRYIDPKNKKQLVDPKKESYWMKKEGVDMYVGGTEHATRHLIYARFWHKFLFDIGIVTTPEPFAELKNQGLIMGSDGRKMSKRWGNVVNPEDVISTYGADTLRVYEMFMGPFDQPINWSTDNMIGSRRFLERVWKLQEKISDTVDKTTLSLLHKTIKKVTEDIANFSFNTAISSFMILSNQMDKGQFTEKEYETLLQLLAPFAPHMTDELWNAMGHKKSIHISDWPKHDNSLIIESEKVMAIQINGKTRATINVTKEMSQEAIEKQATTHPDIVKWLENKVIRKVIVIPGKVVNIVV